MKQHKPAEYSGRNKQCEPVEYSGRIKQREPVNTHEETYKTSRYQLNTHEERTQREIGEDVSDFLWYLSRNLGNGD